MPIAVNMDLDVLSQDAFAKIAYNVMREVFRIHSELGHMFDEKVYQNALISRLADAEKEVRIDLEHNGFSKSLYMDVVVSRGAVFEIKAARSINHSHKVQLLNYLFLSGLHHGKLVNFGTDLVQHEFINSNLTQDDRRSFKVIDANWHSTAGFTRTNMAMISELARDWGTGLLWSLYNEAAIHLFGGEQLVVSPIEIISNGTLVGQQQVAICDKHTAFKITTLREPTKDYRTQIEKLLRHTSLKTIQWININRNKLSFITIT